MDLDIEEKKRKVIPRWRDFKTTLALGELHPLSSPASEADLEVSIDEQLEDWEDHRSLAFATDLLGAGLAVGKTAEVRDAAKFVLSEETHATDLQKRIAHQALDPNFTEGLSLSEEIIPTSSDEIVALSKVLVHKYRKQLHIGLRNPVIFVELAREYATLGSLKKALRAMDVAIGLAPANRFVLRSAARLFVHAGEIERAHYVLKKAPSLRSDPWLLAAEIAVSSMREVTSSNVRTGMHQIDNKNHDSFDLSELTSAIATLEMENANSRLARKLFRRALIKPTENSIAQAEWASRSMTGLSVEPRNYNVPRKYEALAWSQFAQGELESALEHGKNWIRDQPFAVSPVTFTGIVTTVLENFDLGETVMRFGLRANPDNVILRNNLAFALASNNEPYLAQRELARIDRSSLSIQEQIAVTATEGLIEFRKGFWDEGRNLYRRAIDLAERNNEPSYVVRALIFLAREEIYAQTSLGISAAEKIESETGKLRLNPDLKILVDRLISAVKSEPLAFRRTTPPKQLMGRRDEKNPS